MSRSKKRRSHFPPRLKEGDRVRVKIGICDTEYPDIPIGGWAGTITEVHKNGNYTVLWSRETLQAMHPVCRKRCERDGRNLAEYVLGEDDLESDSDGPLNIEQPTEIKTRPLSPKDQDDRIRMALGLSSNDPLSKVDVDSLSTYYTHLSKNMRFPFDTSYCVQRGLFAELRRTVTVVRLFDLEEWSPDEMHGLFCEIRLGRRHREVPFADLEADGKNPEVQMLEDYRDWFWNYR